MAHLNPTSRVFRLGYLALLLALSPRANAQSPVAPNSKEPIGSPAAASTVSDPLDIQLPTAALQPHAPGRVSGRVVDPVGVPIVGATVKFSDDGSQSQETLSSDDGSYAFANVAAGPFHLTVSAAGFAAQKFSASLRPGEIYAVPQIALNIASLITEVRVVPFTIEAAQQEVKEEEKQRALGIVPNFYVSYVHDAPPLTSGQKFQLAWKSTIDPVNFGLTGIIAGVQQAQDDYNGYGQGTQGYAKRYGAVFATEATNTFIGSAVLPTLLKQDPRYFYKGTGSKRSRVLYALANAVICKGDNGHWQPNYSGVLGGLAAGGVSNLYYTGKDRDGLGLTFENTVIGIGTTALTNLLQEFVIRKLTPNLPAQDPPSGPGASKPFAPIAKLLASFIHEGD